MLTETKELQELIAATDRQDTKSKRYNKLACFRKHRDWRTADAVGFNQVRLTEKQQRAITQGYTVRVGDWTFSPIAEHEDEDADRD